MHYFLSKCEKNYILELSFMQKFLLMLMFALENKLTFVKALEEILETLFSGGDRKVQGHLFMDKDKDKPVVCIIPKYVI